MYPTIRGHSKLGAFTYIEPIALTWLRTSCANDMRYNTAEGTQLLIFR